MTEIQDHIVNKEIPLLTNSIDPLRVDINNFLPPALSNGLSSGIAGLQNAGNTCFMNSTLQCLIASDLLRNRVMSFTFESGSNEPLTHIIHKYLRLFWTKIGTSQITSSITSQMLLKQSYWNSTVPIFPTTIWVSVLPSWLNGYQQQDAQEFLIWLLDSLREEAKKVIKNYPKLSISEERVRPVEERIRRAASNVISKTGNISLQSTRVFADTWLDEIFANLSLSTITCNSCHAVTEKYESNYMISLQLPLEKLGLPIIPRHSTRPIQLEECLDAYFQPEKIDEFACLNCTLIDRVLKATDAATSKILDKLPIFETSNLLEQAEVLLARCNSMNISNLQNKVNNLAENISGTTNKHALYQLQYTLDHTSDKLNRLQKAITHMHSSDPSQSITTKVISTCMQLVQSLEDLLIELEFIVEIIDYISTNGNKQTRYPKMLVRSAFRKQSFYHQPSILIFHIKRFHIDLTSCIKLEHTINFPIDLDLNRYMANDYLKALDANIPLSSTRYQLYGVVEHRGKLNSGHYIAYVEKPSGWYKCSDSHISKVTLDDVLQSEPYMLFYRRY